MQGGQLEASDAVIQAMHEFKEIEAMAQAAAGGLSVQEEATEGVEGGMVAGPVGTDVGSVAVVLVFGGLEMADQLGGMGEEFVVAVRTRIPPAIWPRRQPPSSLREYQTPVHYQLRLVARVRKHLIHSLQRHS